MEKLTSLLEELAIKLNTTTEHLWTVLIYQAKISVITNILWIITMIVLGIVILKLHLKFLNKEGKRESIYDRENGYIFFIMVIISVMWFAFSIAAFSTFGDIISGIFNPEYWALHKILSLLD